ncbi:MAG: elongation factor P [Acidobacteriia bacterium]|nr:elongation factor P [Terriglobia bacterium]
MFIMGNDLRRGMLIRHNNELHKVFSVEHRTPGNLRAFVQAKIRNVRTGAMFEHRFRSQDSVEKVNVDESEMEYLYKDGTNYFFMDTQNYEQTNISEDMLGEDANFLTPNLKVQIMVFEGRPIGIELPPTVDLKVVEVEPGLKSATVSNVGKPAKLETGLTVLVPAFIDAGEVIRVDTEEGKYLERVR